MSQPQPNKLDHRCPQPWIAGFGHALLARDASALPGRRRQPAVGRDLPSVGEASGRAPPTIQRRQIPVPIPPRSINIACGAGIPSVSVAGVEEGVPLSLDGLDLPKQQLELIELTADLTLEMRRQGTAIARLQLAEPLASIATQRLVAGDTLGEQQSFDPVDVLDPLDCSVLRSRQALWAIAIGSFEHIVANAKVFQGGGSEVLLTSLDDRIKAATDASLVRMFPRFKEADFAAWEAVIKRARDGADHPFQATGHTDATGEARCVSAGSGYDRRR